MIDEISVGSLTIQQSAATEDGEIADGHGTILLLEGIDDNGDVTSDSDIDSDTVPTGVTAGNEGAWPDISIAITASDDKFYVNDGTIGMAVVTITGLSGDEGALVGISAGSSQSFRVVIEGRSQAGSGADILDILRSVPASTELFVTLTGTDGQTTTISDPRSTRVTQR